MNRPRKIAWTREERWGLAWPILIVGVLVVILVAIGVAVAAFVAYLDVVHEPASARLSAPAQSILVDAPDARAGVSARR